MALTHTTPRPGILILIRTLKPPLRPGIEAVGGVCDAPIPVENPPSPYRTSSRGGAYPGPVTGINLNPNPNPNPNPEPEVSQPWMGHQLLAMEFLEVPWRANPKPNLNPNPSYLYSYPYP